MADVEVGALPPDVKTKVMEVVDPPRSKDNLLEETGSQPLSPARFDFARRDERRPSLRRNDRLEPDSDVNGRHPAAPRSVNGRPAAAA
jgi:hypothetical protein